MNKRAIILMAFSLLMASSARADLLSINLEIDGLNGDGSFKTDGVCLVCMPNNGLSEFVLSWDGKPFTPDKLTFFRASNSVSGSLKGLDDVFSRLLFTPSGNVQFLSKTDGDAVVLHGDYGLSADAVTAPDGTRLSGISAPIALVPEAGSVALLITAAGLIGLDALRRTKRSF